MALTAVLSTQMLHDQFVNRKNIPLEAAEWLVPDKIVIENKVIST
jgi:hypothetical protein